MFVTRYGNFRKANANSNSNVLTIKQPYMFYWHTMTVLDIDSFKINTLNVFVSLQIMTIVKIVNNLIS